jgi:hypothetical protein
MPNVSFSGLLIVTVVPFLEEEWTLTVDLEVGRCYQFRYRRDGEWINDGQADGYVHNRFGSDNFLVVTDPKFKPYADGE